MKLILSMQKTKIIIKIIKGSQERKEQYQGKKKKKRKENAY